MRTRQARSKAPNYRVIKEIEIEKEIEKDIEKDIEKEEEKEKEIEEEIGIKSITDIIDKLHRPLGLVNVKYES